MRRRKPADKKFEKVTNVRGTAKEFEILNKALEDTDTSLSRFMMEAALKAAEAKLRQEAADKARIKASLEEFRSSEGVRT